MIEQPADIKAVVSYWPHLASCLFVPHTEAAYRHLVAVLDALIDEVGEDEANPLASLMEVLGVLIEHYEDQNVPELTRADGAPASLSG